MLNIYLARHGQDGDNAQGILNGRRNQPLTELGQNQAKELAEKIKETGLNFDKIYSSPLDRAYSTAKTIAHTLELPEPEKLDLLIERDFGVMTGKPTSSIEELCAPNIIKTSTITYFLDPEGAETFPDLLARAQKILDFISKKHPDGNILLVAHGDIGKMIYCAYYHLDWEPFLHQFHFGNSDLLCMSEKSSPDDAHVIHLEQFNL